MNVSKRIFVPLKFVI